jgi:tetratricopeptide (TPR) repeat protein
VARIDRLEEKTRELVKVASVIGRSFFYRVVKEVAEAIEDLNDRLMYLKEIQLIRERRRLDELEYLFKHALAQEAAYESLLIRKRQELHLRVADTIETVFKEKLYEFYGMLAYHYGRGKNEKKAQVYLIKAGEEALKSSASSEALHYYQEALNLYLRIYGTEADPQMVASIEKNIALALYYRGRYPESISYIDKVLEFHGFTDPGNIISKAAVMLSGLMHLILALYLPFFKWRKTPSEKDRDVLNMVANKIEMYTHTDPVQYLISFGSLLKILTRFELAKIREGKKMFVMFAPGLTWPCISFKLAGRIIEAVRGEIEDTDIKTRIWHRFGETMMSAIHLGFEFEQKHYDAPLVESSLKIGEFFPVSSYLVFCAWIEIERGRFYEAIIFSEKLLEIAETYDNEYARALNYEVSIRVYIKFRKLNEALSEAEKGIPIMDKVEFNGLLAYMYGHKAQTQILLNDMQSAEKSLNLAIEYEKKAGILPPMWLSAVVLGQFIFDLRRFEETLKNGNSPQISFWRKKALKSGKREMKIVVKLAQDRTAAYRHMGVYFWLTGKKNKAALWWKKSMSEGERLNARIPLSRTYFEVGKRMLETASECKKIRGLEAEQYLLKAKEMFKAMDLQWDMEELVKMLGDSRQEHFGR